MRGYQILSVGNIQTRLFEPRRDPEELRRAFLVTSEGIKRDNKTGLSRYPSALPSPSELLPLESLHCVSRTTNSNMLVVFVKQPLFHLVLPEYPSSTLCSISKCSLFSLFLVFPLPSSRVSFLSLSPSFAYLTLYSHYFFLVRLIPGIVASLHCEDVPREKRRSIEYRLRSIWNARNEEGRSHQLRTRYDVSEEKTVNRTI